MYAAECWTITKNQELVLLRLEGWILRRILGAVHSEGIWQQLSNEELMKVYKGANVATSIKCATSDGLDMSEWLRMAEDQIPKNILNEQIHDPRGRGRPRLQWAEGMAVNT